MSFTIGEPVAGRPPKPDPYRPLAALLEALEIGGSLTVPLAVPIADDRVKVGNAAISALRRYAEEQGVGLLKPVCALTDEGLTFSFTKTARRVRKAGDTPLPAMAGAFHGAQPPIVVMPSPGDYKTRGKKGGGATAAD